MAKLLFLLLLLKSSTTLVANGSQWSDHCCDSAHRMRIRHDLGHSADAIVVTATTGNQQRVTPSTRPDPPAPAVEEW